MEAVVAVGGIGQQVVGEWVWYLCLLGLLVSSGIFKRSPREQSDCLGHGGLEETTELGVGLTMRGEDLAQREEV